jgi:hypothetical protein
MSSHVGKYLFKINDLRRFFGALAACKPGRDLNISALPK